MSRLDQKTALVVGGESGIGRAVSTALASAGAVVRIAGILPDEGAATIDAIRSAGGTADFSRLDVRDATQVTEVVQRAHPTDRGLDILIYCAGVFDNMLGTLDTSEALWDQVMDINLKGCFLANQAALQIMLPRRTGRIVNLASVASFTASADGAPYTASKHGMIGLTKHIARRYSGEGITANCVCPGIIETNIVSNTARILGKDIPPLRKELFSGEGWKRWVPAGRQGRVEEVADAVLFLAAGNSSYITGQSIVIDGGWLTA
jgi:NAD(P)-dependent dehydrogenase (short-subunit alcohol dehydrogenase family)